MQSLGHGFSYQKKIFEQCGRRRNRSSRSQWLIPHRRLTLNPNQSKKRFTWLKRITLTHWFFLIPQWSLLRILHIGIPNGYQNLSWRCTRSVKIYKARESMTSRGKWGEEYEATYQGRKVPIEQHLALGKGKPDACLRIHFYTDEKDQKYVIAHVGRHKTNTST